MRKKQPAPPSPLKILIASAEIAPFAATGNLGQTICDLSRYLLKQGVDVRVFVPCYGSALTSLKTPPRLIIEREILFPNGNVYPVSLYQTENEGVPLYLVDNPYFFSSRSHVYAYHDDAYRFAFFDFALLEILSYLDWQPDVLHAHDWHTGLLAPLMRSSKRPAHRAIATVFTIHEISYQGNASPEILEFVGLGREFFHPDALEFYGQVNMLKGGIVYSDLISATSEQYAAEIQTVQIGAGLGGVLQWRHEDLKGITHGIDDDAFSPGRDRAIAANYYAGHFDGKARCKLALQTELKLPLHSEIPILIIPSRYADEENMPLLLRNAEVLRRKELQLVIVGKRLPTFEESIQEGLPKSTCTLVHVNYEPELARRLWAGADMLLMPQRLKPRTEELRMALHYGTIPITYGIKGLDTNQVTNFSPISGEGTGFLFYQYTAEDLAKTLKTALDTYHHLVLWERIMINALSLDLSWDTTAQKYIDYYRHAIATHERRRQMIKSSKDVENNAPNRVAG